MGIRKGLHEIGQPVAKLKARSTGPTCTKKSTSIRVRDTTPVILMTGYAVFECQGWLYLKGASFDQMSWLDLQCAIR